MMGKATNKLRGNIRFRPAAFFDEEWTDLVRLQRDTCMETFWCGWAGGVAGVLVSHPLDVLRTRQAVCPERLSLGATARACVAEAGGGWRGVQQGLYVGIARSPCQPIFRVLKKISAPGLGLPRFLLLLLQSWQRKKKRRE